MILIRVSEEPATPTVTKIMVVTHFSDGTTDRMPLDRYIAAHPELFSTPA